MNEKKLREKIINEYLEWVDNYNCNGSDYDSNDLQTQEFDFNRFLDDIKNIKNNPLLYEYIKRQFVKNGFINFNIERYVVKVPYNTLSNELKTEKHYTYLPKIHNSLIDAENYAIDLSKKDYIMFDHIKFNPYVINII